MNGFNFGDPWRSFGETFDASLALLERYQKPVFLFSLASASGTKKASWIDEFFASVRTNSRIAGWAWFHENKERDWRIWSDDDALAAFRKNLIR